MRYRLAERVERNYRFVVLTASVLLLFVGMGSQLMLVIAFKPIAADLGWSRSAPSIAYAVNWVGGGFGAIAMGYWMDRSGVFWPVFLGALMIGSGAMVASAMTSEWQLYVAYGLMMGLLGHAALFVPLMTNVTHWFERGRGRAIGIAASGQSLAGILWPPVFRYVMDDVGWRDAFYWYGVFALVTMVMLSLVLVRPPPGHAEAAARKGRRVPTRPVSDPLAAVISPGQLQLFLSSASVGCCVAMAIPLAHIVSHATDLGHPQVRAVELLSMMLLTSLITRVIVFGQIADRLGGPATLLIFSAGQAGTLLLFAVVESLTGLYMVAVLYGFAYGGIGPCYTYTARQYLAAHIMGRRYAMIELFAAIGMAIGGWLAGFVFDLAGTYRPAFLIGVAFNLANLCVVTTLWRYLRRRAPARSVVL